jgi:hypothetical protein
MLSSFHSVTPRTARVLLFASASPLVGKSLAVDTNEVRLQQVRLQSQYPADCPLCIKFGKGPCAPLFKAWYDCTDAHDETCVKLFKDFADCLEAHSDQYEGAAMQRDAISAGSLLDIIKQSNNPQYAKSAIHEISKDDSDSDGDSDHDSDYAARALTDMTHWDNLLSEGDLSSLPRQDFAHPPQISHSDSRLTILLPNHDDLLLVVIQNEKGKTIWAAMGGDWNEMSDDQAEVVCELEQKQNIRVLALYSVTNGEELYQGYYEND